MTLESYGTILGVLGFAISVYNLFSAIRSRTVNPQPPLLAELGGYLELTAKACQQLRPQLNFDRHLLHTGHRPQINPRPAEFDTAISRMPELGRTVTSIGQHQIALLTVLINNVSHNWDVLNSCVISDPVNVSALEFSQKLKRQTRMVERFFPHTSTPLQPSTRATYGSGSDTAITDPSHTSCSDGRRSTMPSVNSNWITSARCKSNRLPAGPRGDNTRSGDILGDPPCQHALADFGQFW